LDVMVFLTKGMRCFAMNDYFFGSMIGMPFLI